MEPNYVTVLFLRDSDGNRFDTSARVSVNVAAVMDAKGKGLKIIACVNRPELLGKVIRQEHEAKRLMANGIFQSVWNQLERKGRK